MSCLGSYFALTAEDAERFLQAHQRGKSDRLAWLHEYETQNFASLNVAGWVEMTDRAWDAIHRCLTDGKLELGTTPRHLCVLGPNEQYFIRRNDGELEYIVNLLEPADVRRVVDAVRGIDEAEMRSGYEGIDPDSFYATQRSEDDFEYTWSHFVSLRAFFERAAAAGRWVLFHVDQ